MLFSEKLKQYDAEVKTAVDKLFAKAFAKQSHDSDLLLILIHGFYREDLYNNPHMKGVSPYVYGLGDEGLMHGTQFDFYDWFRRKFIADDKASYNESLKVLEDSQLEQSINTQLELMLYLKFWESDLVLKQFVNLCRLIHGEHYDWHLKLGNSRKTIIENHIKGKTKALVPKFYELISEVYNRQIRNAAAHSQFRVSVGNLNLFNYDPDAGHHLKNISIEEWETIFHKTILLYNHLIGNLEKYHAQYRELALNKHFGHNLRITMKTQTKHQWLRLMNPEDINSQWIWYTTYSRHYISRFYII